MRRAPMILSLALLLAWLVGCGPGATTAPAAKAPAPAPAPAPPPVEDEVDPTPPDLRLPTTVRPLRNEIELTLDPRLEEFTGKIAIDLEITEPTKVMWLNQEEITITGAAFHVVGGGPIPARAVSSIKDYVALVPDRPLPAGKAKLLVDYTGKMHKDDGTGIYPVKEGEHWYAFTQFEALDAREAFPCFDEPSFKVPWKLSIRTRKELVALSNTPVTAEKDAGNGMKLVEFAETKPLPSYLVAFAVGPFDLLDAGKTRGGAPIRIVVPKGRGGDAGYAVKTTRPLVDLLEDYFGMPYPFEKLDLVAVPIFNAGAMENPGLITYRQELVLVKPAELTQGRQESFAEVTAHELAHQWFGNYVTLAWWDDIWLNESFATWMGSKIVNQWKPEWDGEVGFAGSRNGVMGIDSMDTARAIRQPITTRGDIDGAFDGITYGKGMAVLNMIERHVGAEAFQKGVRAYLAKHAWGNATYDDFVAAISTGTGKDLKPLFDSFVLQSGVPLVSFEVTCPRGGGTTIAMTQRRYRPTGSSIDPARTWTVPICVKYGGAKPQTACTMLTGETGQLALPDRCPDWVMPNAGGSGYYRMVPKGKLLDQLLARPAVLSLPERVALLGDVNALVAAGDLPYGKALEFVGTLAKDKSPHMVDASVGIVGQIDELVPDRLRANYERLIRKLYRARAVELGWKSKPGEDDKVKRQRALLLGMVAVDGNDRELQQQGTALGLRWLDDHAAVEPELVDTVLGIAVRKGDAKLFERIRADAKKATESSERKRLLGALGSFEDPALVKQALAIGLTDEFETRDALGLMQGAFGRRETRELGYAFVKQHFDQILAKLPEPYRPYLAFTFVPFCDDSRKAEFEAFFKPRMEKLDGGPRVLAQAFEQLALCSAARKAQAPAVEAFLRRQ